jgi:predicted methyltransferase
MRTLLAVTLALSLAGCAARHDSKPQSKVVSYRDPRTGREGFAVPRNASPLFEPVLAPELLEGGARDRWQHPARVVRELGLRPGQTVADVGSGSGYLLPYLSRAVGPAGRVYAEEIQSGFLPALRRRAAALHNAHVVLGTADDPRLPRHAIDCFVLLTVYHEVARPIPFLRTLHAAARPGARLAIIDFDAARHGNPPAPIGHEIADVTVIAEARAAGWQLVARHEFLSSQFFLVFRHLP